VQLVYKLLELYRRRFEAGDREAGLRALRVFHEVFLSPAWLAEMVCRAISDWLVYRAPTLDEAFGVPKRPGTKKGKGKRAQQRRERERLRSAIVFELVRLQQQEKAPMDNRTFERVGEKINKSPGYVSRVYYEVASMGLRELALHLGLERIAPAKNSTKRAEIVESTKGPKV
jgi:hypothetical protein